MMISRRPVLSPGRVEKYPPPFMGFLRSKSNNGSRSSRSRSKGRSRASPLFIRRNNKSTVTQEPSSPKVTCMGQVRVKNRSKPRIQQQQQPVVKNPTRKRCEWIRNASFYNRFAGKIKTMSFRPNWGFFCSRRKSNSDSPRIQLDCPVTESAGEIREVNVEEEEDEEEEEEEEEGEIFKTPKLYVSPVSTPPINAFLLTRSRSAPYSSSSLAFRFWEENNQRELEESRNGNVRSENPESEVTEKINGVYESAREEVELTELRIVRRPELTRSKSEPARIGEKRMVLLPD